MATDCWVGAGQPHPFSSPESETLKWVSTIASSGPNIVLHCVTLGQGFSKDQGCAASSGFAPVLPLPTSWATTAPPVSVSPNESHTQLDQVQLPRDRGIPTLARQPGPSRETRPSPSWPASPLLEQPQTWSSLHCLWSQPPPAQVSAPVITRKVELAPLLH